MFDEISEIIFEDVDYSMSEYFSEDEIYLLGLEAENVPSPEEILIARGDI